MREADMSDAAEADRLQVENRKLMLELQQLRLERELGELRRGGERKWPQPGSGPRLLWSCWWAGGELGHSDSGRAGVAAVKRADR